MSDAQRTVRLAIIGCGGIARAHLRGYERIQQVEPGKVEIVAVCDPVVTNAESFAEAIEGFQGKRPRVYTDHEALLKGEAGNVDAADIITPHHLHHVIAVACLEAGLHVMVEKPVGVTIKATQAIVEAAKRRGKFAATAEQIRRGVAQRTAFWLFNESKLIGEPTFFYAIQVSHNPPPPAGREPAWHWRVDRMLSGGGLVLDSGAHFCDTVRYFFGEVKQVHAVTKQLVPRFFRKGDELVPDEREDTWMAILEFERGVMGFWSYSTAAPMHRFTHVVYYATEGAVVDVGDAFHGPVGGALVQHVNGRVRRLSDLAQDFRTAIGEEAWQRLFPHGITDQFTLECYDFVDAVQNNRPPEVTAEDGLKAKAIAIAIYEAATTKRTVRVADVLSGAVDAYQRPINERWGL
ncbi:Glucose--fructose oxidoreductase [bacterium HR17]|uniref:Glucose--fructose oxidoreductase n=1 Tax=Candidatus Fervidibacter japonicus TaxID=2035412 RepID=A0A2H5X9U9_9BACT|nr:Glucose--fructose oxidoreductase [bacterium HR17]